MRVRSLNTETIEGKVELNRPKEKIRKVEQKILFFPSVSGPRPSKVFFYSSLSFFLFFLLCFFLPSRLFENVTCVRVVRSFAFHWIHHVLTLKASRCIFFEEMQARKNEGIENAKDTLILERHLLLGLLPKCSYGLEFT